ncbi:MAG TPA: HEAT repeat domain-containing protein, partial [Armatimonadota bacterium]|nr:HEAT repeat domain-containing protein [Armatimonadota bacterium]
MDTTTDDVKSFETETTEQLVALVRDEGALPGEREAACWELYRRQDRRAVPALIAALKSRHSTVATTAACALFAFTSKRAVKPLIAALRGAVAWETRCAAAITLLGMGDERAISPLVKTLNDTCEQVDVRGQAAKSLGSLLDRDSVPEGVRTAILRNLEDPAPEVRFWCAYALSQFGDGSVIPHLRRVADDPARVARWRTVGEEANWAISVLQSSTTY